METDTHPPLRPHPFPSTGLALTCLASCVLALPAARAEAGSLVIPAWAFARGNAQVHADPGGYADAGPLIGSGPRRPWGWTVEYDVEIPVMAKYTLQICYASAEARPIDVSIDDMDPDKCCEGVTLGPAAAGQPARPTFNSSGAKWEGFYKRGQLSLMELPLTKGTHTIKLARGGPLPHIVALRLGTPTEFPADWTPPKFKVRDIERVPPAFRDALKSGLSAPIADLPLVELPEGRPGGMLEISACSFDRGNAAIYACPSENADGGPMIGGGSSAPAESVVEYDVEFPVAGEYTIQLRYSAAEARPVDVWFDGKQVGTGCTAVTIGSSRFEKPVWFSWSSRVARWEQLYDRGRLMRLSVSKGRHTVKLTRRGPLPNVVALRLISREAFPKDFKQPQRKVDLSRVQPRCRGVFLPPGAVNVAGLRAAIADTMAAFGARYPEGKRYLDRLSKLEAEPNAAEALVALRREAMLSHPAMKFDKLLFIKRTSDGYGHTYADQHGGKMGSSLCVLSPVGPDGEVAELVPELAGGLFDRFDLSYDARRVVFGYKKSPEDSFRVYEIEIDPAAGRMVPGSLRQLTSGGGDEDPQAILRNAGRVVYQDRAFDDMDPIYLPDGRIMFTSTRAMQLVFCAPGSTVTTLYVMDADGRNVRRVSDSPVNETAPSMLADGRVVYTRWEYVDKGLGNGEGLWAIRPDGTGVDHVYKNNTVWPAAMGGARCIPGTSWIVTIAGTHHFASVGSVVLVDMLRGRRTTEAMTCITPEIGYPPSMGYPNNRFGTFMDPYPLSEKLFLVSHRKGVTGREKAHYKLCVLDAWGNRAELYRDPNISCFEPAPLRPRPRPTKIARTCAPAETQGRAAALFVQDVYEGMTGIERGRVKYIRVMAALAWPWNEHGISWSLGKNADPHRKKIYGLAKVHKDGSCYFTVPPGENLFFQALDEDFMALQQMPTFINLMPGEQRACIGCHERRRNVPSVARGRPLALAHPPQTLMPQPGDTGPRMVHYATDVQATLDRHCVRCHSGEAPKGRLDLTGVPTEKFNRSHENLINRRLVSYADCRYGSSNFRAVPPLSRGSHLSKLTERIRRAPCKADLTREEFIRIVTWIDSNVPYYGTYRGKRSLRDKDDPEFRLPPRPDEARGRYGCLTSKQ